VKLLPDINREEEEEGSEEQGEENDEVIRAGKGSRTGKCGGGGQGKKK